jgi:hypothetical protein
MDIADLAQIDREECRRSGSRRKGARKAMRDLNDEHNRFQPTDVYRDSYQL